LTGTYLSGEWERELERAMAAIDAGEPAPASAIVVADAGDPAKKASEEQTLTD
jgi:hypothetical protein